MKKNILYVGVGLILLAVIICMVLSFAGGNGADATLKNISVEVIAGDKEELFSIETEREKLADALLDEKIVSGEMGQYGLFIKEANGIKADESKEEWWCITKGGEDVLEGVSGIKISDGDKYELTLKKGYN